MLLDLTAWHAWNVERGTLPPGWRELTLEQICGVLQTPLWQPSRPWRVELPGIAVSETKGPAEKTLTWTAPSGVLTSRWVRGPDADWWQSEYPVKTNADLAAARQVAEARRYVVTPPEAAGGGLGSGGLGSGGLAVIELPQSPWSELLHSFVGWSEGVMLLLEEPDAFRDIVLLLEERRARLASGLAQLPADLVLLPDNLDGQFITPQAFEENLAPGYAKTAGTLHAAGKRLVVHVGGPVRRLVAGLAACGIDCIQGVCGPPQGDTTLEEAREIAGPGIALWGGIPQDCLLSSCPEQELRAITSAAFSRQAVDSGVIVGVSDRVPVDAAAERLAVLTEHYLQ